MNKDSSFNWIELLFFTYRRIFHILYWWHNCLYWL